MAVLLQGTSWHSHLWPGHFLGFVDKPRDQVQRHLDGTAGWGGAGAGWHAPDLRELNPWEALRDVGLPDVRVSSATHKRLDPGSSLFSTGSLGGHDGFFHSSVLPQCPHL